jgi:hypothetical protein
MQGVVRRDIRGSSSRISLRVRVHAALIRATIYSFTPDQRVTAIPALLPIPR